MHLEAVKRTLGALSFTVDQALHVSAAISGCAGFDENEKKSLQQLVTKQMEGTKVLTDKTRTKSQDWSRMDHFLTESIWQALEQKPFRDAMDRIICHLWRLGLRNPSEGSKAWITALLLLYQPSKTPFELRTTFTTAILNKTAAGVKVYNSTAKPGDVLIFPDAAGILQWILTDGSHGVFLLQRLELVPSTVFNIPFPALSRSFFLFPPSRIFFINCTDSLT